MLDAKKATLLAVSISLAIALLVLLPVFVSWLQLNSMPEQTAQVKVLNKGRYTEKSPSRTGYLTFVTRYATFEFPDGSLKSFRISSPTTLDAIQKGATGLLTYKERKDRKLFVSFEKN